MIVNELHNGHMVGSSSWSFNYCGISLEKESFFPTYFHEFCWEIASRILRLQRFLMSYLNMKVGIFMSGILVVFALVCWLLYANSNCSCLLLLFSY